MWRDGESKDVGESRCEDSRKVEGREVVETVDVICMALIAERVKVMLGC